MTISLDKKYKTRDGCKVRLFVTDAQCNSRYPVHGEFEIHRGQWVSDAWTEDGSHLIDSNTERPLDLVEIKPTVIKPYRFYRKPDGDVFLYLPDFGIYRTTLEDMAWRSDRMAFLSDAEEIDNPFLGDNT